MLPNPSRVAARHLKAAMLSTADFSFWPTFVKNMTVQDIEAPDLGTSGLQGQFGVRGDLLFKIRGADMQVPVQGLLEMGEHPHSGHINWMAARKGNPQSEFIAAALNGDTRAENELLKLLRKTKIEFVSHANNEMV